MSNRYRGRRRVRHDRSAFGISDECPPDLAAAIARLNAWSDDGWVVFTTPGCDALGEHQAMTFALHGKPEGTSAIFKCGCVGTVGHISRPPESPEWSFLHPEGP